MRLWTIQNPVVWDLLRERGVYRSDGRRVAGWRRPGYRWMISQMERRLPGYPSGRYPVWAWHAPKPDMRRFSFRRRLDGECVRLTLEISDEEAAGRVLLSDLDAWGWHVLYNCYLWLSDEEYEWWMEFAGEYRFETEMPERLQEMVYQSWERIFDLEALDLVARADPEVYKPARVQATLGEIRLGDVVTAERFGAKSPKAPLTVDA